MEVYSKKILVVDDDLNVRRLLAKRLTILGYKVFLASHGKDALIFFHNEKPDLIVLDIVLSKLDGYEVCSKIREISSVPIIILTTLDKIPDRLRGFELGVDDYILKPFSSKELEARIKTVLRRTGTLSPKILTNRKKVFSFGNLVINTNTNTVLKNNKEIKLTGVESSIMQLLVENAGKILSRANILQNIWGYMPERAIDTRIVDVHISRLRSKIEENRKNPEIILTVRGIGYKFPKY